MSIRFIKKFSEEERVKIVEEALEYGSNALVAAKYGIHPVLLSNWKGNYRRYGQTLKLKDVVDAKESEVVVNYKNEYRRLLEENKEKDLEIAVLRDLLKKKNQK